MLKQKKKPISIGLKNNYSSEKITISVLLIADRKKSFKSTFCLNRLFMSFLSNNEKELKKNLAGIYV